jgi:hypothetical protein
MRWILLLLGFLITQALAQAPIGPASLIPIGPNTNNTLAPPPPPVGCQGVIDLSAGCPLPMLGVF